MKFLFLDFEATDKDPKTARITQMAYAIVDASKREQKFYTSLFFDSNYPELDAEAEAITGISRTQLSEWGEHPEGELMKLVKDCARVDYIVGHNIRNYDDPLFMSECERYGVQVKLENLIDTRFDIVYPDHITTRKLTHLCADLGIIRPGAHAARHDVDMTVDLFFHFDIETTLTRAKSPDIYIRADVKYDQRELAKERKYSWDGEKKIWVKQIKELDLAKEKEASFPVLILRDYKAK